MPLLLLLIILVNLTKIKTYVNIFANKDKFFRTISPISLSTNDKISACQNYLVSHPIYLVGMMGSGKSMIGKKLSSILSFQHFDTDDAVALKLNKSISSYFKECKEKEFRELETAILQDLSRNGRSVISTGGGIVTTEENWKILQKGVVVYLNVSVETIFGRLSNNKSEMEKRPLLCTEDPFTSLTTIFNRRKEQYERAHISITMHRSEETVESTLNLVVEGLCQFIQQHPNINI